MERGILNRDIDFDCLLSDGANEVLVDKEDEAKTCNLKQHITLIKYLFIYWNWLKASLIDSNRTYSKLINIMVLMPRLHYVPH